MTQTVSFVMTGQIPIAPTYQSVFWTVYNDPDYTGAQSGYGANYLLNIGIDSVTIDGAQVDPISLQVGGDLSGSLPNPNVVGLQGRSIATTAPSTGQALIWNGTAWAPGSPILGELSVTDNSSGQLMGAPNTYYKITQWNVIANAQGVTPSIVNSNFVINTSGWYFTSISLSCAGTAANTFKLSLFQNNVIHPNCKAQITMANTSPPINAAGVMSDINFYNAGDILDLRVTSQSAGVTFTISQGDFCIFMIR